ncbi:acyl transferase/acyl hydrolase/lysophospholipase [Hypoxylon cercidicola]|nr:acyl transferase/acyl hydrolase/lysophospholipase [Hypoxylon cercidicola]
MDFPLSGYRNNADDYEDSPWAKKTVLAFDGGGIRGYSSLLVLKCLMTEIRKIEQQYDRGIQSSKAYPWRTRQTPPTDVPASETAPADEAAPANEKTSAGEATPADETAPADEPDLNRFLPCHYFDYIAGTSTGGLSAIMLGRLRMSVDEALKQYTVFGNEIFGRPRWWHERTVPLWYPRAKYSTRKTREAFKKIIKDSLKMGNNGQPDVEPFKYREDRTRTIVFSWVISDGVMANYIWRTFDHEEDKETDKEDKEAGRYLAEHITPSAAHTAPIWQVARATSAAPTFFESIQIGDDEHADGAMFANNPSYLAVREIHRKHRCAPELFISIGCGLVPTDEGTRSSGNRKNEVDTRGRFHWVRNKVRMGRGLGNYILDPERSKTKWEEECRKIGVPHGYRLNVAGDLYSVGLDEWLPSTSGHETVEKIKHETDKYLSENIDDITRMARVLVDIRRERSRTVRWESFALDTFYRCRPCGLRFGTRRDFKKHVKHSGKHEDIHENERERFLNEGRQG